MVWRACFSCFVFFATIAQCMSWSFMPFASCSGCVGIMMLGLLYFMVSKQVMCPPLKIMVCEFRMYSCLCLVESHVCMVRFLVWTVFLWSGMPRLIILFMLSFFSAGIIILVSLALVPYGPLIGANICCFLPFTGEVSVKFPVNSALSRMPMLSRSPMLYSLMVYGGGLSGMMILLQFLR